MNQKFTSINTIVPADIHANLVVFADVAYSGNVPLVARFLDADTMSYIDSVGEPFNTRTAPEMDQYQGFRFLIPDNADAFIGLYIKSSSQAYLDDARIWFDGVEAVEYHEGSEQTEDYEHWWKIKPFPGESTQSMNYSMGSAIPAIGYLIAG